MTDRGEAGAHLVAPAGLWTCGGPVGTGLSCLGSCLSCGTAGCNVCDFCGCWLCSCCVCVCACVCICVCICDCCHCGFIFCGCNFCGCCCCELAGCCKPEACGEQAVCAEFADCACLSDCDFCGEVGSSCCLGACCNCCDCDCADVTWPESASLLRIASCLSISPITSCSDDAPDCESSLGPLLGPSAALML